MRQHAAALKRRSHQVQEELVCVLLVFETILRVKDSRTDCTNRTSNIPFIYVGHYTDSIKYTVFSDVKASELIQIQVGLTLVLLIGTVPSISYFT